MPELPEVESVRRSLEARVLGCTVTGVIVRRREVIATPEDPVGGFSRQRLGKRIAPRRVIKSELLVGARIDAVRRHGKQLALVGSLGPKRDDAGAMLIHLGMTGEVMAPGPGERLRAADHLHVLWTIAQSDGSPAGRMVFRDPRRFGGIWTLPDAAALDRRWAALGPDALTVTGDDLAARLESAQRPIKAALLDQRALAGVGNIYADESLHRVGLHPECLCASLSPAAWNDLAAAVREVLSRAVELRGSTIRDYRDAAGQAGGAAAEHRVYGRAGKPCLTCGGVLSSGRVAQRTTVWCDRCQP